MTKTWAECPWEPFNGKDGSSAVAWHKHSVAYRSNANALQTLDIWLPSSQSQSAPPNDSLPTNDNSWAIYIHGGAWRDPLVSASSFNATVKHIISKPGIIDRIGGLASLNYSLSPHPHHATDPSPPKDPSRPIDPSRTAKHPDHIRDVLTALAFLQDKASFGSNYVLVGHSCGATLAFQVAMDIKLWELGDKGPKPEKPKAIIGVNGLYDLPRLISEPGEKHKDLIPIYEAFTKLAFGGDVKVWHKVSTISVDDWSRQWTGGMKAVFAQSNVDTMVPYRQTRDMMERLRASKGESLAVSEVEIVGDHNDIWDEGHQLAKMIENVVEMLQ